MSQFGNEHEERREVSSGGTGDEFVMPDDDDDRPLIPVGVIDGINDLAHGNTADAEDIEAVLKD